MKLNYNWTIQGVSGLVKEGNLTNVVKSISWTVAGYLVDNISLSSRVNGITLIDEVDSSSFIDYMSLTKEDILNWLFTKLDKTKIENNIAEYLKDAEAINSITNLTVLPPYFLNN